MSLADIVPFIICRLYQVHVLRKVSKNCVIEPQVLVVGQENRLR